jgi:hypothetical protein
MFYEDRARKPGTSRFGRMRVEYEIIVTADGVRHVNAKPRPACTR